jgi:site-specific DNA-cytosine methylase
MKVLSLFDGMSCGRLALEKAGFKVDTYYASEIDKHAIKVSGANWPSIIQVGDVTAWKSWDLLHGLDWASIDLVIGGSPCQGFSFAGKQLAFDDPRSALFFTFVDILNHVRKHNPKVKFILENVKMKKVHLEAITDYMGVEPIFINSALVSAQNRKRYYWTSINRIEQPEDRGIFLEDILEEDPKKITLMSEAFKKTNASILRDDFTGKAKTLSAMEYVKNGRQGDYIKHLSDEYRKLTPIECERLQTVPDNYTNHVSNTQRYRMLGNGWNVDTIVHLLNYLK